MSASGAPTLRPRGTVSLAGYLAYLYGLFGVFVGLAAAFTFIPYRYASTYSAGFAELFTVLAVLGTFASAVGVLAGWGLFRSRSWAWGLAVSVAVSCIALNAILVGYWNSYVPFLGLVTVAYGLEIVLLFVGSAAPRGAAAPRSSPTDGRGARHPATGVRP